MPRSCSQERSIRTSRNGRHNFAIYERRLCEQKPSSNDVWWSPISPYNQSRSANCSRSATVATKPCWVRIDRYSSTLLGGFLRRARTLRSAEQTKPGARDSWCRVAFKSGTARAQREWTKHGGHAARFLFATVSRPSRTAALVTATR